MKIKMLKLILPSFSIFLLSLLYNTYGRFLSEFSQQLLDLGLGLNKMYVWFLLPTYPIFFNPTLNIKMIFGEKIPKMGAFSDVVTIFFVKCYNKI